MSLLQEGEAKIFLAEGISSLFRYQVVTAVPEWRGGKENEKVLLRKCYENSLEAAIRKGGKEALNVITPEMVEALFKDAKDDLNKTKN